MALTRVRPAELDPDSEDKPWIEFKKLMREPCALVVFRVKEELEPLPPKRKGGDPAPRVLADVLIVSLDGKTIVNELHRDESILGNGITKTLLRAGIGKEVPARIDEGGTDEGIKYPQANDPDDDQIKVIESVYRERWWESNGAPVADASDAPF